MRERSKERRKRRGCMITNRAVDSWPSHNDVWMDGWMDGCVPEMNGQFFFFCMCMSLHFGISKRACVRQ